MRSLQHCLVTGATGFIGRALCRRLKEQGVRVRALARHADAGPWDEFVAADLAGERVPAAILDGVDTVFHLAGKAHALSELAADDGEYRRSHVGATRNLLGLLDAAAAPRLVFFSSVKAMGDDGEACMDERWDAEPSTPYGICKRECEQLVLDAGRDLPLHACVLRLPLVYGRGVKGNLWKMLDAIARGRFPPPPRVANKRSLVHVDDVAGAALQAALDARAAGRIYIVTDGEAYSTDEMYTLMRTALGKPAPGWRVPAAGLRVLAFAGDVIGRARGRRFVFDSDAYHKLLGSAWYSSASIERDIGFRPTRTLRDGVVEMVEDYRGARN